MLKQCLKLKYWVNEGKFLWAVLVLQPYWYIVNYRLTLSNIMPQWQQKSTFNVTVLPWLTSGDVYSVHWLVKGVRIIPFLSYKVFKLAEMSWDHSAWNKILFILGRPVFTDVDICRDTKLPLQTSVIMFLNDTYKFQNLLCHLIKIKHYGISWNIVWLRNSGFMQTVQFMFAKHSGASGLIESQKGLGWKRS